MAEDGEHQALLALEAAVLEDVEQLSKVPLSDKARSAKVSAAILDKLARIRAVTRDLEAEVEELDSDDEDRASASSSLAQHKAEYARLQAAVRDAAIAQRTAAQRSAQEERKELLAGGDVGMRQRRAQMEGDAVATAEEVTGGLRRTRQVLAEELEHTGATLAAMEASHTQLGRTRDEYHGQHGRLRKSRGLLGTLSWQAKSETYMLWAGLAVFLAVCAYVLQKRTGHFVPDRLKPTNLLGALAGPPRVGKPLTPPAPVARLHGDAPPPGPAQPRGGDAQPVPPPQQQQPAQQEQREQQWQTEEEVGAGRGRAPPPLPRLPPHEAPTLDGAALDQHSAPAPPLPYGGFAEQEEEHVPAQVAAYAPQQHDGHDVHARQLQADAAAEAHPPAEWPAGAPEPGDHVRREQQQHTDGPAAVKQGQAGAGAGKQQPYLEDPPLPALDEELAAAAEAEEAARAAAAQQARQDGPGGAAAGAGVQQGEDSVMRVDQHGRRIAVDGPGFVRQPGQGAGRADVAGEAHDVAEDPTQQPAELEQQQEEEGAEAEVEEAVPVASPAADDPEEAGEPEEEEPGYEEEAASDDGDQEEAEAGDAAEDAEAEEEAEEQQDEHEPAEWPTGGPEPGDEPGRDEL